MGCIMHLNDACVNNFLPPYLSKILKNLDDLNKFSEKGILKCIISAPISK